LIPIHIWARKKTAKQPAKMAFPPRDGMYKKLDSVRSQVCSVQRSGCWMRVRFPKAVLLALSRWEMPDVGMKVSSMVGILRFLSQGREDE